MKTVRYTVLMLAFVVSAISLKAQTASFLNVPDDARGLAMGGADFVRNAESVLDDTVFKADVSYYRWTPEAVGTNMIDADITYNLGKLGFFVKGRTNVYDPYPMMDGAGADLGLYSPNELMAGLGAAYEVASGLAVSVLAKYVGSNLAPEVKTTAFCADVNVLYRKKDLTVGLLAANLGSSLNFGGSKVALPMLVKAGAQNNFNFGEKLDLLVGLDAGYMTQNGHNAVTVSAGADLKMFDIASLRAGYHFSSNAAFDPSYISAGLGVDVSVVSISAAYLFGPSQVAGTLCAAIGVRF